MLKINASSAVSQILWLICQKLLYFINNKEKKITVTFNYFYKKSAVANAQILQIIISNLFFAFITFEDSVESISQYLNKLHYIFQYFTILNMIYDQQKILVEYETHKKSTNLHLSHIHKLQTIFSNEIYALNKCGLCNA